MKRRTFIVTITAATAVIATPILYSRCSGGKPHDPLVTPEMLSRFCDTKTLRDIGKSYRKQVPEENAKGKLIRLLLTDQEGKEMKASDKSGITALLERKVHEEFSAFKTLVMNGWVITATEARQCALFSLT